MQSDYMYSSDVIYSLSGDVKIMFKTVASVNSNNRIYSNCSEFKLNNNTECNTMIKRTLQYYLFIDDRRNCADTHGKVTIYPEHMLTLLSIFEYIKVNWIDNNGINVYGYLDNALTVISDDYKIIKLPLDKVIRFAPGVFKSSNGDKPCIDICINITEPLQISFETFYGLYFSLSRLDMLGYANTTLSFMMLRYEPSNRIDYSSNARDMNNNTSDKSTASGTTGRTFSSDKGQGLLG